VKKVGEGKGIRGKKALKPERLQKMKKEKTYVYI